MLYLWKTKFFFCIYTEQCRDHEEIPIPVQFIIYLNAAGSIYLPEKKVQPQKKKENTYCSIFSTKIQKFYKKSIRSVL